MLPPVFAADPPLDAPPPDDEPPDVEVPEPDVFDPPDESADPLEPVEAATFLSPFSPPDFSPPADLSPDPSDGAVLFEAALESVR